MRTYNIGISGSYGGLNLGDEAILQSMISQLNKSLSVNINVFTRDKDDTQKRHNVKKSIPVRDLSRNEIVPEIEKLDLFILGGGGILFDAEVRTYLREVELALEKKIPVMVYAISAGPLLDKDNQKYVTEVLNKVDIITVRERSARKILEESGLHREIIVTADPSLLLKAEPLPPETLIREQMHGKKRLIAMSVREPGIAAPDLNHEVYHKLLANAADYMVDRYNADIVFIPMERKMLDMQQSHAVISQMLKPQHAWVLKGEYTSGQLLTLMKHFKFAVGMRLHFLIFAALQEVPFVALPYSTKVGGLLDDLHIKMPPIQLVNEGRLIAHIDNSWDKQQLLKNKIKKILPHLKKRSGINNELAIELLTRKYNNLR